uniref:Uncharacterized protein n=1 Tax=Rhizophora mucronata TaxID=61149 RepID=A0A2P2PFI8_RHIMU
MGAMLWQNIRTFSSLTTRYTRFRTNITLDPFLHSNFSFSISLNSDGLKNL